MERQKKVRHGSLFSGIGGFDLAAEWMGWTNVFHCEFDPFCQNVLKYYYPNSKSYGDIKKTDFRAHRGGIDILSGGFPCQPYSIAGKRQGTADERHLWPDMLRAILEIRPMWVVGENVRGIISWNDGLVFEQVQADLEAEGYQVQAYVLPAAGINAPHRRERVWFIAYRDSDGCNRGNSPNEFLADERGQHAFSDPKQGPGHGPFTYTDSIRSRTRNGQATDDQGRKDTEHLPERNAIRHRDTPAGRTGATTDPAMLGCNDRCDNWQERSLQSDKGPAAQDQSERQIRKCRPGSAGAAAADTGGTGLEGQTGERVSPGRGNRAERENKEPAGYGRVPGWQDFPQTEPTICRGNDGIPGKLDFDALFELYPSTIMPLTFPKWRTESIKVLGNAIVPQLALQIFKAIEQTMRKLK